MVNSDRLRNIFGQFASGVTVITCVNSDGEPHGATVTAFTAVSLQPRLCQVTLTRKSKACNYLTDSPFAVNILAADQLDTALHFAGKPAASPPTWADGPTAPTLTGCAATLSCQPWRSYDGGDHLIFLGEIVDAEASGKPPLLYYRSTFHDLGEPSTASLWTLCADDPHAGWFDSATTFTPFHLTDRAGSATESHAAAAGNHH